MACILAFISACQTTPKPIAKLEASITGLTDSVVYITRAVADSAKTDTVPVKEGKFTWSAELPGPQKIYIGTQRQYLQVFMENSPVSITGHIDSFDVLRITGSAVHDELVAFENTLNDIEDLQYNLYLQRREANNDDEIAALRRQSDSLEKVWIERTKNYIRTHPGSMVSAELTREMAADGEWSVIDSLYRALAPQVQQSYLGSRIARRLEVLKRSEPGQTVKDIAQNDVNGKPVKFSDFRGKYLYVDFWASWCGPCRAENPNVVKAYNTFKNKNFDVLGISLDENEAHWKDAIQKDGLLWTQLSDLKGWDNEIARYYGIQAIPFSFLLDPNGVIIAKGLRGEALRQKLAEILQ